jgi:hypothetical protein
MHEEKSSQPSCPRGFYFFSGLRAKTRLVRERATEDGGARTQGRGGAARACSEEKASAPRLILSLSTGLPATSTNNVDDKHKANFFKKK